MARALPPPPAPSTLPSPKPTKTQRLSNPVFVSMASALDNGDLLMEILLWLPVKSLITYKSVCKKWRSVISSEHFCHQHTIRHPKLQQSLIIKTHTLQLFYFNQTTNGENVMIPYTMSHPRKIVQGCNGLLLIKIDNWTKSYYVYNPTTRRSRMITLTNNDTFLYVAAITLAFDPSRSPYYKVVCVRSTTYHRVSCAHQIEVYDSESHTWKLSLEQFIHPRIYNDGVHWNNSIFWSTCNNSLCCYDIAKNEIKTLSFPTSPYAGLYYNTSFHIQESNGHLYCFELLKRHKGAPVEVAVSELGRDDHSQWLSKHHDTIHMHPDTRVVRFMWGSGDKPTRSLLTYDVELKRMMTYSFLDKSYQLLVDFIGQPVPVFDQVMKVNQFGEILALV